MTKDKEEVHINIKEKCNELRQKVKDKVEEHPYALIGVGLGIGLFTGLIVGRLLRCRRD